MTTPHDPHAQRTEKFLWNYMRRQLEAESQGEAALHLQYHLKAKLREVEQTGEIATYKFDLYHRLSDFTVELNAQDGDLMGWFFSLLAETPGRTIPPAQALKNAEAVAQPPQGAILVHSEYEDAGGSPVFIARWEHREGDIPVERDYIHVTVNGKTGKPFAFSRKWHQIDTNYTER